MTAKPLCRYAATAHEWGLMMLFRLPLASALALALIGTIATQAHAVEPDAPDRLMNRMEATFITLHEELSGRSRKKLQLGKDELKGFADYYRGAETLMWVRESGLNERAEALRAVFKRADDFGLASSDYNVVDGAGFAKHSGYPAEWLADAELKMSAAAFSYARDAQTGRVVPTSIDKEFLDLTPVRPEGKAVLKGISDAGGKLGAFLEGFHPLNEQFKLLKAKLAEVRSALKSGAKPVRVPEGPALGPNTYHPHVALLRTRFSIPPSPSAPNGNAAEYYDDELASAVRAFQASKGLKADGVIGRETRDLLNEGSVAVSAGTILANMERWRWEPRDFGEHYVWINLPEFLFRVIKGGRTIHEDRIVVGSPKNPTPVFSDEMEFVVFNPYWHVPKSIIVKEIIPTMQSNPGYLSRNNIEVVWQGDRTVDPFMVDWYQVNPDKLSLRQVPGPGNALGQVKFLFPNKHSVYMHDTPTKQLFDKPVRAYSHGCMRVRNPLDFARLLLADQGWSDRRIQQTLTTANDEQVKLEKKVPVHITYFTLWVDKDGKMQTYRDIYTYDAAVRVALKIDSPKVIAAKTEDFDAGERGLRN
jgi:murein L,D-transpeptidase YcbB/YkuD